MSTMIAFRLETGHVAILDSLVNRIRALRFGTSDGFLKCNRSAVIRDALLRYDADVTKWEREKESLPKKRVDTKKPKRNTVKRRK